MTDCGASFRCCSFAAKSGCYCPSPVQAAFEDSAYPVHLAQASSSAASVLAGLMPVAADSVSEAAEEVGVAAAVVGLAEYQGPLGAPVALEAVSVALTAGFVVSGAAAEHFAGVEASVAR